MHVNTPVALALSAPVASAVTLHAASYAGVVSTLDLALTDGVARLEVVGESDVCGGGPSWLEIAEDGIIYCSDEGISTETGGVAALTAGYAGLELVGKVETEQGPVSSVRFGAGGLMVAQYSSSMVNVLDISDPAAISLAQNFTFTLDGPGANPDRQEAPHPHQATIDPTGAFLVVPDLGADLVRVFSAGADGAVDMLEPLAVEAGSGPRHVSFLERDESTLMYLISELSNTISGYVVAYPEGGIAFEELFTISTHGEGESAPEGASAAEILVSPDGKFLTVSSRLESAFMVPHPTDPEADDIPSDTLVTFSIDADGGLTLVEKVPAGGRGPRHFSFNAAGNLLAVGLQQDFRVVVMARDVDTGKLLGVLTGLDLEGEVTCVVFDE